jgi:hypothetical protein
VADAAPRRHTRGREQWWELWQREPGGRGRRRRHEILGQCGGSSPSPPRPNQRAHRRDQRPSRRERAWPSGWMPCSRQSAWGERSARSTLGGAAVNGEPPRAGGRFTARHGDATFTPRGAHRAPSRRCRSARPPGRCGWREPPAFLKEVGLREREGLEATGEGGCLAGRLCVDIAVVRNTTSSLPHSRRSTSPAPPPLSWSKSPLRWKTR